MKRSQKHFYYPVNTGNLLVGLVRHSNIALNILRELGTDLKRLKREVRTMVDKETVTTDVGQAGGFTNSAKKALKYAEEEAKKVSSDHLYSEHLLLGLTREKKGIASKSMNKFNVTLDKVRTLLDSRPFLQLKKNLQLNPNHIDRAIRDLIYVLNKSPFVETCSSCSGHPDFFRNIRRTNRRSEGEIKIIPIGDPGETLNLMEFICDRLDNTRGMNSIGKEPCSAYTNRTFSLYKQVGAEALYASSIPILTSHVESFLQVETTMEKLRLMWQIALRICREYTSSSLAFPLSAFNTRNRLIDKPKDGSKALVNLLEQVSHIQAIYVFNRELSSPKNPKNSYTGGAFIYLMMNRNSIMWGSNFVEYLKARLENELNSFNRANKYPKSKIRSGTIFSVRPMVKRGKISRSRDDHLKIWKLIELAAREYIKERFNSVLAR